MIMSNGMVEGEVPVTIEDKEKIITRWNEIVAILNKYEEKSCPTDFETTMSRVKSAAAAFSEWVKLLHLDEEENMFVLIEASKLSLNDNFMQYKPTSNNQRELKKSLTEAIKSGLSDFWAPRLDPSYNEEKTGLVFKKGKMPAAGNFYNWWKKRAEQYLPERGSRLGTKNEYVAFLGVLIKKLIASGWHVSSAWYAVCDNSRELGHYWDSENAKHDFEPTGSREVCAFCDLANTFKILAGYKKAGDFWIAGGAYDCFSYNVPLASLCHYADRDYDRDYNMLNRDYDKDSVGWIVLSK